MSEANNDCFPRGGKIVKTSLKRPKEDDNLFSSNTQRKAKKPRKDRKKSQTEKITDETFHSQLKIQGNLSYNTLRSNMQILGCIRHITNFSLEVELPGLIFGTVAITNISDSFTKHLSACLERNEVNTDSILKSMFQIGQFVLVKVANIEHKENSVHVECTMNPKDIYSEKSHSYFKKGMLVWASVQSVLDHGYELNVGVKNCRVFLPIKNIDATHKLAIGAPLWCTVHKCDSSPAASTLRVSCKDLHLKGAKIEEIDSLDSLIPGMQIEFLTEKVSPNGIQGKFLNDYFGYIDETQLKTPQKNSGNYQEHKLIAAFVMYVDHATKVTHLTMRNLDVVPAPTHKNGEILTGQVVSRAHNGVYLSLPSGEKCFVSNRRLVNSLGKNPNLELTDAVKLKYDVATKHTCRLLDYNHLSRFYIGTVEQALIREKIFHTTDLTLGQLVNVEVQAVKPEGLVVSVGHTRGFVPNMYLSNVAYSETIKKKYQEGNKLKARVLNVEEGNLQLTLKPGQVNAENTLAELGDAKRGDRYTGVVVFTQPEGALVKFYGNVKGWISAKYLDSLNSEAKPDPRRYFYKGEVVNVWVLGVKNDSVILSLKQPAEFRAAAEVRVGQKLAGFVGKVYEDKLEVKSKRGKVVGVVPVNHLGSSVELCASLLRTYKTGDEMNDVICIDTKSVPHIYSRREFVALESYSKLKLRRFEKLIVGNLVRCSFISRSEAGINVMPLILDHTETILIRNKDIVGKGGEPPQLAKHQSIIGKILEIDHTHKKIRLSVKLSDVFNNSVEWTLAWFSQHLSELKRLRRFGRENDWEVCRYGPGERVSCKVEKLGEHGGCLVRLPNGLSGLVAPRLCPSDLSEGEKVAGVVLAEDFEKNFVEVCLRRDLARKIDKVQDGRVSVRSYSSCVIENVVVKPRFVLGVLRQEGGNKQLIYMPMFRHENDFDGCRSYYEKSKLKVCICGKVGNYLIGMSKKLFLKMDKTKALIFKEKSSRLEKRASKPEPETAETEDSATEPEETTSNDSAVELLDEETASEEDARPQGGVKRTSGDEEPQVETAKPIAGISSLFFQPETQPAPETSSDEEEEAVVVAKKQKKLSAKERAEQIRVEEERIARIENELADLGSNPQNADQFDRLLLANPDSSELWTKYIAFYAAASEFEKAKAVAKRALDSIKLHLVDERFNIWMALLNLENLFGTKESFDDTFDEAVRRNDSLRVYLRVIQSLAEAGKLADMEEKAKKCRNKHKQEPRMWLELARAYYSVGRCKEARNIKDAALKSVREKKTQFEMIVRFAIMEFKYGEAEHAAAVFETVLSSDPRKVNIWTTYVDQLVKKGDIESARRVLDRAVSQRLPLKSMRTLFAKFRIFEERHGSAESLEAVKERAKEFVDKFSKKQ